jgi:hypothetical protein
MKAALPSKDELVDRLVEAGKHNRAGSSATNEPINAVVATVIAIVGVAVAADAIASIIPGAFSTLTSSLTGTDAGTLLLKGTLYVVIALVIIVLFFKLIPE